MILNIKNSILIGLVILELIFISIVPEIDKVNISNSLTDKEDECAEECLKLNYTDYFYGEGHAGITCFCKTGEFPVYITIK